MRRNGYNSVGTMTCGAAAHSAEAGRGLSRRQSRRKAFELLFELAHRPNLTAEQILARTFTDDEVRELFQSDDDGDGYVTGPLDGSARRFVSELVLAVTDHEEELDAELAKYPHEWSYDRIGVIERVLLKLSLAEMVYLGTSYKVVINETLDLAKLYAQEEARRFINGILGAAVSGLSELQARARGEEAEQ
jgi:N utilization substance protein B